MFNLATIYLNIARMESVEAGNDNERLRNAIKSYQFATGLFDRIKKEDGQYITEKEITDDLRDEAVENFGPHGPHGPRI